MDKHMALKPRMSEKTYELSQRLGTYVFEVPRGASKQAIAKAVESQFNVTVKSVNVANAIGKTKRSVIRATRRPQLGKRADTRRAYVTLKSGDSIPIFAAVEQAEAEAAKADKKADKKEAK